MRTLVRTAAIALAALALCGQAAAHSGKARFHVVVDTDAAADDLRTLCMLLGNREVEVVAITTSDGILDANSAAAQVNSMLRWFGHEGIGVGCGRDRRASASEWRAYSERINWGGEPTIEDSRSEANARLRAALGGEEEKVTLVALGALTNFAELLAAEPSMGERIERIVWYSDYADSLYGFNFEADTTAARQVLDSGVRVDIISSNPEYPVEITAAFIDSLAEIDNRYARKIVDTHRAAPLSEWIATHELMAWDDLTAVYLFAPQLFAVKAISPSVRICTIPDSLAAASAKQQAAAILRGKPDTESRVLYGFPLDAELYATDVAPIIDLAVALYGRSEWRAAVLTNELHGHLGIYATIGVKMGIRAREYFNIGIDDIKVTSYAGSRPPVSCLNDGLQVSTGATVGHGLIEMADVETPRLEALFAFKGQTIRLALKPEYAERIAADVQRGVERYGNLTEEYWLYVRALALRYWVEFDRNTIFELTVE